MPKPIIYPTPDDLVRGTAEMIVERARMAVASRGRFTIALAGGNTPRPIYALLATPRFAKRIPWDQVHVFFGDERCVPPTDERSNYRMAREALLDHVPLPAVNIHRAVGEDEPARAARSYEQDLRRHFGSAFPVLDLICLGLGDDGHTASLFPGTAALRETKRLVVSQQVEAKSTWRLTFTPPLINAAREVAFLVTGASKAAVLARVLNGPHEPDLLPAQLIQPTNGQLQWLVDTAAASQAFS